MAGLFTRDEFASYLQVPEVDNATTDLLLDLVTAEIRWYASAGTYDAMSDADRAAFKGIALEVAKRSYLNPSGLRSETIDDYSQTFATETMSGAELTEDEQARIDRVVGRASGAFTIRPAGVPDCPPARVWARYC